MRNSKDEQEREQVQMELNTPLPWESGSGAPQMWSEEDEAATWMAATSKGR